MIVKTTFSVCAGRSAGALPALLSVGGGTLAFAGILPQDML